MYQPLTFFFISSPDTVHVENIVSNLNLKFHVQCGCTFGKFRSQWNIICCRICALLFLWIARDFHFWITLSFWKCFSLIIYFSLIFSFLTLLLRRKHHHYFHKFSFFSQMKSFKKFLFSVFGWLPFIFIILKNNF